jgi:putative heme degradation protein
MTEPVSYREALPLQPLAILQRAHLMGRALVGMRVGGTLLERIGVFDGVAEENGLIVAHGALHETRIDPKTIVSIVTDRSETPHDTILTYIDFLDAKGDSILKVTALDGPAGLMATLEGFARSPLPYVAPLERSTVAVDSADTGAIPLLAAHASQQDVTLAVTRDGGFQSWTGKIAKIHFGHNYINIIQPEVHLHLRGRAVAEWTEQVVDGRVTYTALEASSQPIGLTVSGAVEAFAPVAVDA